MLNTKEIYNVLKRDEFSKSFFKMVLPRDKLPRIVHYPSAYVVNTDNHDQSGEHWVALYYDSHGFCTFFDSFGRSPEALSFHKYINKTSRGYTYNSHQLQSVFSTTCGYYTIYFVLLMCRGFSLDALVSFFDRKDFVFNDYKILHLLD
jgi:hypothetical protein